MLWFGITAIDADMNRNTMKNVLFALVSVLILSACTTEPPYIYKADEFNRNAANFAKEPKDRTSVEICYNKRSSTPKLLLQMAADECRRYGKRALFNKNENLECTISSPAQAVFWCLAPGETAQELLHRTKQPKK